MSLIPWNPLRDIENFGREAGGLFNIFPAGFFGTSTSPKTDIYQTDSDVIIKAEIPGVSKDDLKLYIDENSIKLSGQYKRESEFKDESVYKTERYYGNFSRSIPLPVEVKSENAKAQYKDGILSITVPKVKPTQSTGRKIDIQ